MAIAAALAVLHPGEAGAAEPPSASAAAASLAGSWSNARQYARVPDFLKRPPAVGAPYPWLDRQHAHFRIVPLPQVAGPEDVAIYLEWRKDGPDGAVSRQRLWLFKAAESGQGTEMLFFSFRKPADFEGASGTDERFAALTPDDLVGYSPACSLAVAPGPGGWNARIAETCHITTQTGRRMRLGARIAINEDRLFYEEEGQLPDGSFAFRVPGGIAYEFSRLSR